MQACCIMDPVQAKIIPGLFALARPPGSILDTGQSGFRAVSLLLRHQRPRFGTEAHNVNDKPSTTFTIFGGRYSNLQSGKNQTPEPV
ncbi:hypothetical protein PoB_005004700 [Plakobranchus ocellatus]|uniref:Uncharacterized protein n=1 Tax=Plakobranchus ocellatus TaxID=259542 RepID=A0AAV4BWN4_9GAST|nr:hypothetical protein PoB_005004700 [Plakobranchus ocellatus]